MEPGPSIEPPQRTNGAHLPADAPLPSHDDPTADGNLCGARRSPQQINDENPWPYCNLRAGHGTNHPGIGRCRRHGGMTPSHQENVRLQLQDLMPAAIRRVAQIIADDSASHLDWIRAFREVANRTGYPARLDVDVVDAKALLIAKIEELRTLREEQPELAPGDDDGR